MSTSTQPETTGNPGDISRKTPDTARPSVLKGHWWRRHALPFLLYLAGAIAFTWPTVTNLAGRVVGSYGGDTYQHIWHLWWVRHSLLDLHTLPYYTDLVFYQQKVSLLLDSLNFTTGLLSLPVQLLFGPVVTFNLLVILFSALGGYAMYLLASYLTSNRVAAFVAGMLFAYMPYTSQVINLGQGDLLPTFWLPLFLLCFLKATDGASWWYALGAAVIFVLMAQSSWYFAYYGLILGGLIILYQLLTRRKDWRSVLVRGAAILGGGLLVLSPIILRTAGEVGGSSEFGKQSLFDLYINSAALGDWIRPGSSLLWSLFGTRDSSDYQGLFVGFVGLTLAAIGLVKGWKAAWPWLVVGLVFFELSLGPTLRLWVKDEVLLRPADHPEAAGLPLPNRLLYNLPLGDIAAIPLVAGIVVMLALSVLAAFGLRWLLSLRLVKRPGVQWGVAGIAAVLILLEFVPIYRATLPADVPQFYRNIQNEPGDFAVLDLPRDSDARAMFYQTVHNHPMVGGYLARTPNYPFELTPGLRELRLDSYQPGLRTRKDVFDPASLDNTAAVLNYYNIRYAILHRNLPNVSADYAKNQLDYARAVFGATPFYEDADIIVWRMPDIVQARNACGASAVVVGGLLGWNERDFASTGEVFRWMNGNAEVNFFNPTQKTIEITLSTRLASFQSARTLTLSQGGTTLATAQVGTDLTPVTLKFKLAPGPNRIAFKTDAPGTKTTNAAAQERVQALQFYPVKITGDGC